MSNVVTVKQEDTSDTIRISPYPVGELVNNIVDTPAGWSCRLLIIKKIGDPIVIDRLVTTISADQLYFEATLEPQETMILNTQAYIWVLELENLSLTPKYRKEHHIQLVVEANAAISSTNTEQCYPIVSIGTLANDYEDKQTVVISSVTLPGGILAVKLKDDSGNILQTTGTNTVGTVTEIILLEGVIATPTQICVVT